MVKAKVPKWSINKLTTQCLINKQTNKQTAVNKKQHRKQDAHTPSKFG